MSRYDMHLNDKGQCFNCLIKPLTYKREGHYFCHRCSRAFDLETGHFVSNWAWEDEYLPTERAAQTDELREQREIELTRRIMELSSEGDDNLTQPDDRIKELKE